MPCASLYYFTDEDEAAARETAARLGLAVVRLPETPIKSASLPENGCVLLLKDGHFSLAAARGRDVLASDLNPFSRPDFLRRHAAPRAEMLVKTAGRRGA